MEYIGFKSVSEAAAYKADNGGWVFVSDASVRVVWFAPHYTPTRIMLHDVTRGFSGGIF